MTIEGGYEEARERRFNKADRCGEEKKIEKWC